MAPNKRKNGVSVYILPFLFCLVLTALILLRGQPADPVPAKVLQSGEPLTLTNQAIENYLYSDGFTLCGETVLDAEGKEAAVLNVHKDEGDKIDTLTLTFSLPTYYETKNSSALGSLKANREEAAQRGETLFLALFDAISATDGRVAVRRDSALEKLRQTMDTGKSSAQSANSWRFSFALDRSELQGSVTIRFERVK